MKFKIKMEPVCVCIVTIAALAAIVIVQVHRTKYIFFWGVVHNHRNHIRPCPCYLLHHQVTWAKMWKKENLTALPPNPVAATAIAAAEDVFIAPNVTMPQMYCQDYSRTRHKTLKTTLLTTLALTTQKTFIASSSTLLTTSSWFMATRYWKGSRQWHPLPSTSQWSLLLSRTPTP